MLEPKQANRDGVFVEPRNSLLLNGDGMRIPAPKREYRIRYRRLRRFASLTESAASKVPRRHDVCPWMMLKPPQEPPELISPLHCLPPVRKPNLNKPLPPLPNDAYCTKSTLTRVDSTASSLSKTFYSRKSTFDSIIRIARRVPVRMKKGKPPVVMVSKGLQVDLKIDATSQKPTTSRSPIQSSPVTVFHTPDIIRRAVEPLKSSKGFFKCSSSAEWSGTLQKASLESKSNEVTQEGPTIAAKSEGSAGLRLHSASDSFPDSSASNFPESKSLNYRSLKSGNTSPSTLQQQGNLKSEGESDRISPAEDKMDSHHFQTAPNTPGRVLPYWRRRSFLRSSSPEYLMRGTQSGSSGKRSYLRKAFPSNEQENSEELPPTPRSLDFYRVRLDMILNDRDPDTAEDGVPAHLPSSPLCPKHLKHPSGGLGYCPMHGVRSLSESFSTSALVSTNSSVIHNPRSPGDGGSRDRFEYILGLESLNSFEFKITEHPANSPLCPAHPDNATAGKSVCIIHGRGRFVDTSDPLSHRSSPTAT